MSSSISAPSHRDDKTDPPGAPSGAAQATRSEPRSL